MHRILERQIKRFLGGAEKIPPEWADFLQAISDTYSHSDEDRALLDRSLDLSSKEFLENSQKYQSLVNSLSVGVYRNTPGPQGHFLEANPAIIALFEADSKAEFMRHNVSDLYQDPIKRSLFAKKIMQSGFVKNEELELVTLKGKKIICSVSAVMKTDPDGSTYFDGLIEDITARKKAEIELKNAHDELAIRVKERTKNLSDSQKALVNVLEDLRLEKAKDEAMLGSIGDGLIAVNNEGKIIIMNQAAERLLGWKIKEAIGKLYDDVITLSDEKGTFVPVKDRPLAKVLAATPAAATATDFYILSKNKIKYPVAITVTPIIFDNKIIGGIEVFRDITQEKNIDKAKTEFVSLASHQLRTPLSTINWYVEMLLAGDAGAINPKQKQYLDEVFTGSKRMVSLINALLNVSRLELGTFTVEPEPTDIAGLIKTSLKGLQSQISAKKLILEEKYAADVPLIPIDRRLLTIVFDNVLSNAVKYTPTAGSIKVILGKKDKEIILTIADTGLGIPKSQQDKIYDKLFRADNVRTLDAEGTGLGLYLAKTIIDLSGGKIYFESEEGKGTTFFVTLPLSGMIKKEGRKQLI